MLIYIYQQTMKNWVSHCWNKSWRWLPMKLKLKLKPRRIGSTLKGFLLDLWIALAKGPTRLSAEEQDDIANKWLFMSIHPLNNWDEGSTRSPQGHLPIYINGLQDVCIRKMKSTELGRIQEQQAMLRGLDTYP